MYFKNKKILKILNHYKDIWSLNYLTGLSHWDMETYMPQKASLLRGEAMARVSTIRQKMFLDKQFEQMIGLASKEKDLNDYEMAVVRILSHSLKFYKLVPASFLEDFEKLTSSAAIVWRQAKQKEEYKLFAPFLKKIFDANKKMAGYLKYKDSPYDSLLDLFEEGLTSEVVSDHFETVIPQLKGILNKVVSSSSYKNSHFLEKTNYDRQKMIALNEKILRDLWSDFGVNGNFRLDVSSHPFTTSFSSQDTRITTWYHDKDFARSLMATIHEFGHALYDLQSDDFLETTPVAGGSSLVIHESQSRFWENYIGRSKDFIQKYIKDIRGVVSMPNLEVEQVYSYLNQVKPSLLRVEADEVTYHLHIALRYQIEKGLIEEKLKFKDLKEVWSQKMKEYLSIVPTKDSQGVLQDIHWSGGSVGYFPTYSLGTFLGALWEDQINKKGIKKTDFKKIKSYLKQTIHKYGSTYTLSDLLQKNNLEFDSNLNINYLSQKYLKNI